MPEQAFAVFLAAGEWPGRKPGSLRVVDA
jgi:hypothetical protein